MSRPIATVKRPVKKAPPAKPWLRLPARPDPVEDQTVRVYLKDRVVTLDTGNLPDLTLDLSMDTAAQLTVTVADPTGDLARFELLDQNEDLLLDGIDVRYGRVWWRLARLERTDTGWTMIAEDRAAAHLRSHSRPMKASRDDITRAGFVHQLTRGVKADGGIVTYIPEVGDKQQIARAEQPKEAAPASSFARARARSGSNSAVWDNPPSKVRIYNGTIPFGRSQRDNAAQVLATCERLKAPPKATLAIVEACLVEQHLNNKPEGDRSSVGFLQLLSMHLGGSVAARMNIPKVSALFLQKGFWIHGGALKLARDNPGWSAGKVAQMVQGSGYPGRYDESADGARKIIAAYKGGALASESASSSSGSTKDSPTYYRANYAFRTQGETGSEGRTDWWTATGALAEEVQWHRWAAGNVFCFVSDDELIRGTPTLIVDRERPEIQGVSWKWDYRTEASELTVAVALEDTWSLLPGMVAVVEDEAAVSGRWLIDTIRVSPIQGNNVAEVGLRRRGARKLEPAPEMKQRAQTSTTTTIGGKTSYGGDDPSARSTGEITTTGGARGIVDQAARLAASVGGSGVFVVSNYRPGSVTSSGNRSDHAANTGQQAARDIAVRGINALTGPPSSKLDKGVVALGKAFGRSYGSGTRRIVDTFQWRGYRVQIIWRTPEYGGHMGHIHIGVRKG